MLSRLKLFVQIFPTEDFDWECLKIERDKEILYVRHLFEFHSSLNIKDSKFWCFRTNGVFFNSCQHNIYDSVIDEVFEHAYLGVDTVIMSYGQNNSGKTFTLSGFYNKFELRGIIPRFVSDLFSKHKLDQNDFSTKISISVVDIYGNSLYDLLSPRPTIKCKSAKEVQEIEINSELHCLKLLFKSEANRLVNLNEPYKSHYGSTIVTFLIKTIPLNYHEPYNKLSRVHFVDLAGVETIQRNPLTSIKNQQNQGYSNTTKTLLEIFALRLQKLHHPHSNKAVNKRIHILTQYLGESFSPSSCISLICHVRPTHEDLMMTLSLLKFGLVYLNTPMARPKQHLELNYDQTIEGLQKQVKDLRNEILLRDLQDERKPIQISQSRIEFVRRMVLLFLNKEISEEKLISLVDDCSLILKIIKDMTNFPNEIKGIQTSDTFPYNSSILKQSTNSYEKDRDRQSYPKPKVSFQDFQESIKNNGKKRKSMTKADIKKIGKEVVEFESSEVQVNLIEPQVKLPSLDTREGLWAKFVICKPEVQKRLDKLNVIVLKKKKILDKESLSFDEINSSMNKIQLELDEWRNLKNQLDKGELDIKGKTLILYESNLMKELDILNKKSDISKGKINNAQVDWIEAIECMAKEKQTAEEDFKQFCSENNFLALQKQSLSKITTTERESGVSRTEKVESSFEDMYTALQNKYLFKYSIKINEEH